MDIELLRNPNKTFKLLQLTDAKFEFLIDKLLHEYLYISDEYRTYDKIKLILQLYFTGVPSIFYEFPNFGGIIGFTNLIPNYKCDIMFKIWDRTVWNATFLRDLKRLINIIMNEFNLVRMSVSIPDKKLEKLAHMCGFKTECAQKYGFKWNGRYYPLRLLAKTRSPR